MPVHCKVKTIQCPLSTNCSFYSNLADNTAALPHFKNATRRNQDANMQQRKYDELLVQRVNDALELCIITEIKILGWIKYLFCESPLWAVYGVTDRGLPRLAWTSSSPTHFWRHAHKKKHARDRSMCSVCICGSTLTLCAPPPHLHALHLYAANVDDTYPSRSISSALKVNTWGRGHTFL